MAFLLIFNDSICALLYLGAFFCIRESKKFNSSGRESYDRNTNQGCQ